MGAENGGASVHDAGVLALLLAVVGVYGVKSYVVSQRTREIGIRMALGASAPDVLRLILRDGLLLTATGVAIGLPLAALVSFAFTRVFADVGGFDVLVVASATVILAAAATLASAIPARRASSVRAPPSAAGGVGAPVTCNVQRSLCNVRCHVRRATCDGDVQCDGDVHVRRDVQCATCRGDVPVRRARRFRVPRSA